MSIGQTIRCSGCRSTIPDHVSSCHNCGVYFGDVKKYRVMLLWDQGEEQEKSLEILNTIDNQEIKSFSTNLVKKATPFVIKSDVSFDDVKNILLGFANDTANYPELADAGIFSSIEILESNSGTVDRIGQTEQPAAANTVDKIESTTAQVAGGHKKTSPMERAQLFATQEPQQPTPIITNQDNHHKNPPKVEKHIPENARVNEKQNSHDDIDAYRYICVEDVSTIIVDSLGEVVGSMVKALRTTAGRIFQKKNDTA